LGKLEGAKPLQNPPSPSPLKEREIKVEDSSGEEVGSSKTTIKEREQRRILNYKQERG